MSLRIDLATSVQDMKAEFFSEVFKKLLTTCAVPYFAHLQANGIHKDFTHH